MSKIAHFFETVGHDIKVVATDIGKLITKLFGAQALTQLETTAETLLKSDLGQAVLADAQTLLQQVKNGQISQTSAITSLARTTIDEAKKTGIEMETSIATALAALSIGKLSGALNSPNAVTQSAVEAVSQPGTAAVPAAPEPAAADPAPTATEPAAPAA